MIVDNQFTEKLINSIFTSIAYILDKQDQDGKWVDWRLPPGESDAWVTSYIGYKLSTISPFFKESKLDSALKTASDWTLNNVLDDGGWGYSKITGSDADSTAYSLLFLLSENREIDEDSFKRLLEFQSEDGGFRTYIKDQPGPTWELSQTDVTPVALMALVLKFKSVNEVIDKGIKYLHLHQNANGIWNSFWWRSPLYSTYVNLHFLTRVNKLIRIPKLKKYLRLFTPEGMFEKALLLLCFTLLKILDEEKMEILAESIIGTSLKDGSWESIPILRLTNPNILKPWEEADSGPYYADPNRLFTTTTVMSSLVAFYEFCRLYNKR